MSEQREYLLVCPRTELILGCYETFEQARRSADIFDAWEICDDRHRLLDWSTPNLNQEK